MEQYLIIGITALIGSGLTLFSGFGLGTILLPVFGLFFPIEVAIALTALVHFLNNLLKFTVFYKHINWSVILRFGLPSLIASFIGAYCLIFLAGIEPIGSYSMLGKIFFVSPIKLIIAVLLVFFATIELIHRLSEKQFSVKLLPLGGLLSGFFGGLSGQQGALRSAFLSKLSLSKEAFIATGVAVACMVDISRLSLYYKHFSHVNASSITLLVVAVLSAFAGVYIGSRLVKKVKLVFFQIAVSVLLYCFAALLALGII